MPKRRSAIPRTEFARKLIKVRERYGAATDRPELDQKEFAQAIGFSEDQAETYRRYERGETEPPLRVLAEIYRVTGASLDELIGKTQYRATNVVRLPHRSKPAKR